MSESNIRKIFAALALAAVVALPALAENDRPPRVAAMSTSAGLISWSPRVSFDKLVLSVRGGGYSFTQEFRGGQPFFAAVDPDGYQLPDGTYAWELSVIPPALDANNHRFRSSERSADGRSVKAGTAPEGLVQSGHFTIANGAIVDPGLTEPESAAPEASRRAAAAAEIDDSDTARP